MQNINTNHPTEDELELYVLNRSDERQLEGVEMHILACESCIMQLESLELQISATKLALREMQQAQLAKAASRRASSWRRQFTLPQFSVLGAVAALALGMIVAPPLLQRSASVAQVTLATYRGFETSTVPQGRPLQIHLNTGDLADGNVTVDVVDARGIHIWKGTAAIQHEQAEVTLPPITQLGNHFLRLYSASGTSAEGDLIREFSFQVE